MHSGSSRPCQRGSRSVERVLGDDALAGLDAHEVLPEQSPLPPHLYQFVPEDDHAPQGEDQLPLLLGILDDDVKRAHAVGATGAGRLRRHHPLAKLDLLRPGPDDQPVERLDEQNGDEEPEGGNQKVR